MLAKTGISTVPSSSISKSFYLLSLVLSRTKIIHQVGNIGVSPASGSALTGFSLTKSSTGTSASSIQVTGQLLAADYTSPTPAQLLTAISDMHTAFEDASGRVNPDNLNVGGGTYFQNSYTYVRYD